MAIILDNWANFYYHQTTVIQTFRFYLQCNVIMSMWLNQFYGIGGGGEEVDRWRDSNSQFSDFYHLSFQLTSANASHFSDTSQDSGCDQGPIDKT